MREWIEDLSDWMQKKESMPSSALPDLAEEMNQTALETDSLLQASSQLQNIYSQLLGKHVSS